MRSWFLAKLATAHSWFSFTSIDVHSIPRFSNFKNTASRSGNMAEGAVEISVQLQESLKEAPYACSSLQSLSGGTANFVYRGTLVRPLEDDGATTIIIKHSEPYVAQNPAFKLTTDRCVCQALLSSLCFTLQLDSFHLSFQRTNHVQGLRKKQSSLPPVTPSHQPPPPTSQSPHQKSILFLPLFPASSPIPKSTATSPPPPISRPTSLLTPYGNSNLSISGTPSVSGRDDSTPGPRHRNSNPCVRR